MKRLIELLARVFKTRRRLVVTEPTLAQIEAANKELRELAALASSGQGMG
jgi:hypothetical protein